MKIKNVTLNELRDYYKRQQEFVIRIREYKENSKDNKDNKDIVYYNGIKAFEIDNNPNQDEITINLIDNVIGVKKANIIDSRNNNYNLIEALYELKKELLDYFSFNIESIELIKSSSFSKYKAGSILNYLYEVVLEEYQSSIKDFNIEDIIDNLEKNGKAIIKINNKKLTIKDYIALEYYFKYYCIMINNTYNDKTGFKICKIHYKKIPEIIIDFKSDKFNIFNLNIKKAIDKYLEYVKKEEKKYQHIFMTNEKYYQRINKEILPFEEEYCTNEGSKDKGRIDCSYVIINNKKLTDIYLVELKVNDGVVDGTNGVNKHFIDINKMLKNKNKFIKNVRDRVEYQLSYNKNKIKLNGNPKLHFDTIIAITNKDKETLVLNKLNHLNNDSLVKQDIKTKKLPKDSQTLYNHLQVLRKQIGQDNVNIYIDNNYCENNSKPSKLTLVKITKDKIEF